MRPGKNWRIIIIQCGMNMKYAFREIRKSFFLMKEFWHYISWILSEEDRQEIDVLMHLRDGAEFFRKAEEIAANCTVVKGQGFHSEMEVHKF